MWIRRYDVVEFEPRPVQQSAMRWFERRRSIYGRTWPEVWPLHHAAMRGDVERVYNLIVEGADPDETMTDWEGSHPLGWAASFGQLEAVKTLILLGADPFVINEAGNTPLADARREDHDHVSRFLEGVYTVSGRLVPD